MNKAAWTLVGILSLLVSQLSANSVECQEGEYLDFSQRKCVPCRECGPGLELSKDCGYGEGSDAQCAPCRPRRFKDSWGRHGCRPCLSCTLINRILKANCTATSDAVCGECFPGFYRKTQIGGSQDQECVPCTKRTPASELQCLSRLNLIKVMEDPSAPAQNLVIVVLTSSALVIILLLLLLLASFVHCRSFWKSRCQQGPAEAVHFVPGAEVPNFHQPGQHSDQCLPQLMPVAPQAHLARNHVETHPLIRNSGCSDCSAGGFSFPDPRRDSGGVPSCTAPASSCASEAQHCWPHAPVECTELDLQKFSSQVDFQNVENPEVKEASRGPKGGPATVPKTCPCLACTGMEPHLSLESAQGTFSSFRNPTVESGEQLGEDSQCLVTKIGRLTHGLPVASLPDPLVLSLGLQLDPALPGIKNFSHLGMELGLLPSQLSQMSGFQELVVHLGHCESSVPVLFLAQSLQKLQRFDALLLLYDHFTANPVPGLLS